MISVFECLNPLKTDRSSWCSWRFKSVTENSRYSEVITSEFLTILKNCFPVATNKCVRDFHGFDSFYGI